MFILNNSLVELYWMQRDRQSQSISFEVTVRDTQTPAYVGREAPNNIKAWISIRTARRDISPDNLLKLNRTEGAELRAFLLSERALGAVAARGGGSHPLGGVPGVPYTLGERAQKALDNAIRDFGIQIVDDRR